MHSIKILKTNQVYRVTDLIFRRGVRWEQDREAILSDPQYSDTILYAYLTQKKRENDLATFRKIVRQFQDRYEQPSLSSLVVHLRLGDVMDDWDDNHPQKYLQTKKMFQDLILEDLPDIKNATIVTALHFGANPINNMYFYSDKAKQRSFDILNLVSDQLQKKGMKVSYKSSEDIDEDLCYLAGSKYFLRSLSDFSRIAIECMPARAKIWSPDDTPVYHKPWHSVFNRKFRKFHGYSPTVQQKKV